MNVFAEQKRTRRLKTYHCQRGQVEGYRLEVWIGICTLRYMGRLANGDLLYSTENATQCSVIIPVGKDSERERTCVHV